MRRVPTAWQTAGPYVHIGLTWDGADDLVSEATLGARITLAGRVLDGDGDPVTDAMVEIWQANASGKYAHPDDPQAKQVDPAFTGFGRAFTDTDGRFAFRTVKPGPVDRADGGAQAPHVNVSLFARGILRRLVSRVYFEDEAANADDPVLRLVEAERRGTLLARKDPELPTRYLWDVVLRGAGETVFFDC